MADDQENKVIVSAEPVELIEDDQGSESSGCSKEKSTRENERHTKEEVIELAVIDPTGEESDRPSDREISLLRLIESESYFKVQVELTAKVLMNLEDNPLLPAIRITEKLYDRAEKEEQEKEDFTGLANRVEEFLLRFLDPLKYDEALRLLFRLNPHKEVLLETAIQREQRKFFDHPIITDIMADRWYGSYRYYPTFSKLKWFFLNMWCLFDTLLFPLIFLGVIVKARCVKACTSNDESSGNGVDSLDSDDGGVLPRTSESEPEQAK